MNDNVVVSGEWDSNRHWTLYTIHAQAFVEPPHDAFVYGNVVERFEHALQTNQLG